MLINLKLKLNNKQGASFIIALIYFLVAGVVAALIITSAFSNASRLETREESQAAYEGASYVSQSVAGELQDLEYVARKSDNAYVKEKGVDDGISEDSKKHIFASFINNHILDMCNSSESGATTSGKVATIEQENGSSKATITVYMRIDSAYNLACLVHSECENSSYDITIMAGASSYTEENTSVSHDTDKAGDKYSDTTSKTETLTITWQGAKAAKGDTFDLAK